jgi:uncharacterized protein (TIGR02145 family)
MIDSTQNPSDNGIIEKYCYNDDSVKCSLYGGLYQWDEAMQYDTSQGAKGICPFGWHIPTSNDFSFLKANVGYNSNDLKEIGQGSGAGAGTNASGFSALLAGTISRGSFRSLGLVAPYWSSKIYNTTFAFDFGLSDTDSKIFGGPVPGTGGESIRCINDLPVSALSVELTSFIASVTEDRVMLNWSTATETNTTSFEIEKKSSNSGIWHGIASVSAAGNSNSTKKYSYTDKNNNPGKFNYRLKIIDTDGSFKFSKVVNAEINPPVKFELLNAFPNPFNPTTTIKYQIPTNTFVTIKIYDGLGKEVIILVNELKNPGRYEVIFNGKNLPSGVYYYQINAGGFIKTKKLMLMK